MNQSWQDAALEQIRFAEEHLARAKLDIQQGRNPSEQLAQSSEWSLSAKRQVPKKPERP